MKTIYLLGGKIKDDNVIFVNKDGSLRGSENLEEAKKLLPNLNGYHKADLTWSTSATIFWMTFQPRLFEFKNFEEVKSALEDEVIKRYTNVSGSILGTAIKKNFAVKVIEECSLIDGRFNTAKPFWEVEKEA